VTRSIIHFSHANGFPAPCYRSLFSELASEFEIGYVERIGHDARYPVTDGWPNLVDELIDAISVRYLQPVIGIGHSLGGFLTALAAATRPELFQAVILLDAPILAPFQGSAVKLVKRVGLIDRVTPAGSTRYRRREWASREQALAHFKRRPLFRSFAPECLQDYAQYGLVPSAEGVALWFDPGIEYQIYRTIPHNIAGGLKRLAVPGGFIGGRDSDVLHRVGLGYTRRLFRLSLLAGGHLFPFEMPHGTAVAISRMVRDLRRD
jgi:pimeloyl-ACP methyl ester carboxylesterase